MIASIAHINLLVPPGTLPLAEQFYGQTLGLTPRPGPESYRDSLAWFDIGTSGQQVHVAIGPNENLKSFRHPCFKVGSPEELQKLKQRIWEHYQQGGEAAPLEADKPSTQQNSGAQEKPSEYPKRFFARDFAGNRLEFTL